MLEDRVCALPHKAVREILPLPRLWSPPGAPALMVGMLNLMGETVPVVSMRALFGLEQNTPDIYAHVLLMAWANAMPHAFLVDRVIDVVAAEAFNPVSSEDSLNGCVIGELPLKNGDVAHVLAADRILIEEEKLRLAQIQEAARARLTALERATDA